MLFWGSQSSWDSQRTQYFLSGKFWGGDLPSLHLLHWLRKTEAAAQLQSHQEGLNTNVHIQSPKLFTHLAAHLFLNQKLH